VQPGTVTGFLGPNGAGKSTTMRLILGLDAPTSGSVIVRWPWVTSTTSCWDPPPPDRRTQSGAGFGAADGADGRVPETLGL